MEKLILRSSLPPGDILMLTAAVRDIHRNYPEKFLTDVRTRYPELWNNNPHITPINDDDPSARSWECFYPLIRRANHSPRHFLEGFIHFLSDKLDLPLELTEFKGDLYIPDEEKQAPPPVSEAQERYWLVTTGGKRDYTIKWWDQKRYQQIVDHFRGRIQFIQVGAAGDYHPELQGVIDLRAKTDLRQLIRLVYHADGILCPVTFLMHLTAAVPTNDDHRLRPCVVIAGGREPVHWEAYPGHQYLHTIGMLPCCRSGGCWRARTKPLRDRSHLDSSEHLCVDVVGNLPRCMSMITAHDVIRRIELYLEGGKQFERLQGNGGESMSNDLASHLSRLNDWSRVRQHPVHPKAADPEDLLLQYYRNANPCSKRPLRENLAEHALTNTPRGMGDTLILTSLPVVAARQGKTRYIDSDVPFFKTFMKYNRFYKPAGDRPRIAADFLQMRYDLGNGHFIQRLQRAMGLQPELLPKAHVDSASMRKGGRVALHFEARSSHAAWQHVYVHPRARELYPESHRIIQSFVDMHPELSFYQVGIEPLDFRSVEDCTNRTLEQTISLLSETEYFIGIVSGPMHLATALGLKCIVILNFPSASEILLPTLKDIPLIESEWLYPQNVHLHQEDEGPLVKRLSLRTLEQSLNGELYPYWSERFLPLIYEQV